MQNRTPSRGLSMHPAFVSRDGATPVPIWFVTADNYAQVREGLSDAGAALRRDREVRAEGRPVAAAARPPTARWAASCSAWKPPTSRRRTASCPAACPACCRPAPIASPTRRTTRGLRRSPSRSAATSSRRYRKADANGAQLEVPEGVDGAELSRIADGVALARDLINTPANDLGPAELEQAARDLASRHGASIRAIVGEDAARAELSADPCGRPRRRRARRA